MLTLTKEIKISNHENEYEIVVKLMHGDADAYTSKTFYYDNATEAEKMLRLFTYLWKNDPRGENIEALQAKINEFKIAYIFDEDECLDAEDFWSNELDRDITCDSYNAAIDDVDIFFYTADCKKYRVALSDGESSS